MAFTVFFSIVISINLFKKFKILTNDFGVSIIKSSYLTINIGANLIFSIQAQ